MALLKYTGYHQVDPYNLLAFATGMRRSERDRGRSEREQGRWREEREEREARRSRRKRSGKRKRGG
jgi:hypothetical protein